MYFDKEAEDAIVAYNNESDPIIRNKIYSEKIAYPFDKLVESIINTFRFYYFETTFDDFKQEVISFLVLNMHKYDQTKGFKAFSYFSVVAKNYLILHNNKNYKRFKTHNNFDVSDNFKISIKKYYESENDERLSGLMSEIILYFHKNIEKIFKKKDDILVAYAIVELLSEREKIENFNKKNLYLLLREMTGLKTIRITKVINEMKKRYKRLVKEYDKNGSLNVK